ncbi:uncharacterized protein LOC143648654 [Tamandua tetradactyla]|uniref:uncharacterized protein LOC143648654 n=1 Tax=Tamandua tetradactyla TaxID=48850 RepID=UPI0040547E1F
MLGGGGQVPPGVKREESVTCWGASESCFSNCSCLPGKCSVVQDKPRIVVLWSPPARTPGGLGSCACPAPPDPRPPCALPAELQTLSWAGRRCPPATCGGRDPVDFSFSFVSGLSRVSAEEISWHVLGGWNLLHGLSPSLEVEKMMVLGPQSPHLDQGGMTTHIVDPIRRVLEKPYNVANMAPVPDARQNEMTDQKSALHPSNNGDQSQKSALRPSNNGDQSQKSALCPSNNGDQSQKSALRPSNNSDQSRNSALHPSNNGDQSQKSALCPSNNGDQSQKSALHPSKNSDQSQKSALQPSNTGHQSQPDMCPCMLPS